MGTQIKVHDMKKHVGRPATGQGTKKYVPLDLLPIFGQLIALGKMGDTATLKQLETLLSTRVEELTHTPRTSALEVFEERQQARKAA